MKDYFTPCIITTPDGDGQVGVKRDTQKTAQSFGSPERACKQGAKLVAGKDTRRVSELTNCNRLPGDQVMGCVLQTPGSAAAAPSGLEAGMPSALLLCALPLDDSTPACVDLGVSVCMTDANSGILACSTPLLY